MPFEEAVSVIDESYGRSWKKVLSSIEETPIGSASIAQVHRAVLKSGEEVVVKIQRKGIYEMMARDIEFIRKAIKLMPPISLKGMADFDLVLDELWSVTRDEMNFLTEAANIEEFARRNKDVNFVQTPVLYQQYTTVHVLVMEYIDGCGIDEKDKLLETMEILDRGFESLFAKIGTTIKDNKYQYQQQITEMQNLIRSITDTGLQIEGQEHRNKTAFQNYLTGARREIREYSTNHQMANAYYQNMANQHQSWQSYFVDQKK